MKDFMLSIKMLIKPILIIVISIIIILSVVFIGIICYVVHLRNDESKSTIEWSEKLNILLLETDVNDYIEYTEIFERDSELRIYINRKNEAKASDVINSMILLSNSLSQNNITGYTNIYIGWFPICWRGKPNFSLDTSVDINITPNDNKIDIYYRTPIKHYNGDEETIELSLINFNGCTSVNGIRNIDNLQYNINGEFETTIE